MSFFLQVYTCFSDKIWLFISDAAPYMVLAGKNLHHFYSRAIHVTCVAHGIHRICEQVRQMFPKVNSLLSCSRKILLKFPFRIQKYKEKMQCALPPDVVVTRWGTWLQGAMFFANNFQNFEELVEELPDDSHDMKKLKMLLTDTGDLSSDLAFINSFLSSLPAAITKLETRGLSLNAQIEVIEQVLNATEYFLSRGREEKVTGTISSDSISYLKSGPDFIIRWGCYCIPICGEPSPKDNDKIVALMLRLYNINVSSEFLLEKCRNVN